MAEDLVDGLADRTTGHLRGHHARLTERRQGQRLLGGEVAVERGRAHVGAVGDLLHRRLLVALLGEQGVGGVRDQCARPRGVQLPQSHGGSASPFWVSCPIWKLLPLWVSCPTTGQTGLDRRSRTMAWKLYQLGRWCFRHRGRVVAGWLVLLVLGGVGAATLSGQTNDTFELPSTESSQAFDLIKERTPQAATDGAIARVVVQAPEGEQVTAPATQEVVDDRPGRAHHRARRLRRRPVHDRDGLAGRPHGVRRRELRPSGRRAHRGRRGRDARRRRHARGRRPDRRRGRRRLRRAGQRSGRRRGHRHPGGPRGPGHHLRLAGRRRPAAADRDHRREHRHPRRHHPDRLPRAVLHHSGAGHHARARRRDRLRAVRDVALPPRGGRRARARGGGRPRHRHGRLGRGLRRPHRRHRPRRAVHHRHQRS